MKRLFASSLLLAALAGCAAPRAQAPDPVPVVDEGLRARAAERSFAPGADVRRTQREMLPPAPLQRPDDPASAEIVQVLRAALRGNPNLARYADTLLITVDEGRVRLRGRVDSLADARFLSDLAMEVPGVTIVYADVFVAPPPVVDASAPAEG